MHSLGAVCARVGGGEPGALGGFKGRGWRGLECGGKGAAGVRTGPPGEGRDGKCRRCLIRRWGKGRAQRAGSPPVEAGAPSLSLEGQAEAGRPGGLFWLEWWAELPGLFA